MTSRLRHRMVQAAVALVVALSPCVAGADAPTLDPSSATLNEVTVADRGDSTIILIKTSGAAKYRSEFMDSPNRLVVDLEDTVYAWRKTPLAVSSDAVRQVRGSQYRKGIARVVVEFKYKVGYAIREDGDGLAIIIPSASAARHDAVPPAPKVMASAMESPAAATADKPAASTAPATTTPKVGADKPAAEKNAGPATVGKVIAITPGERPAPRLLAQAPTAAPAQPSTPRVVQAPTTPAPGGERMISLEFKDADVVNLLRILAAESSRNIVIGEDVKGKMSISLRNVPWQLALDTILEAKGLQRVEKDGVMRIVSNEQIIKEREARARVEESKIKGEAEARAKLAEAQVKEAEAQSKRLAAEAAQREQEAKGPLREETIRLSYADPEEVAKTLQGILGIPAEGAKITGPGFLGLPGPPNPELGVGYQAAPPPPGATVTTAPVSVSQDVLNKGLTIRAHKPTNTLFLRLYAADLERVKKLIHDSLDIPLPQVKIEARMEILDRSALEQIGIQWGGAFAQRGGSQMLVGRGFESAGASALIPGGIPALGLTPANTGLTLENALPVSAQTGLPLGGNLVNLPIAALPNAGPLPAAGLAFGIIGSRFNVNLALQALASQGKTRTLARPEIVTVENNKATMSLGEEIPYATISSAGTQIQFKEALLKLEVTPTVIREGDLSKIKLVVIVENNSRGDVVNLGSAGQPPAINRRKAETQVLIPEGDHLVIGGVMTSVTQHTVRKVPLFGDIPILGWFFKQRENFETGRELVVFVTPSIVRGLDKTAAAPPAAPPAPAVTPK